MCFYLEGMDWSEMISANLLAMRKAEGASISRKVQYKRDIENLQIDYIFDLKALGYLLGQGHKPGGISEERLQSFKLLIESLVGKGQLMGGILDVFKQISQVKNLPLHHQTFYLKKH